MLEVMLLLIILLWNWNWEDSHIFSASFFNIYQCPQFPIFILLNSGWVPHITVYTWIYLINQNLFLFFWSCLSQKALEKIFLSVNFFLFNQTLRSIWMQEFQDNRVTLNSWGIFQFSLKVIFHRTPKRFFIYTIIKQTTNSLLLSATCFRAKMTSLECGNITAITAETTQPFMLIVVS